MKIQSWIDFWIGTLIIVAAISTGIIMQADWVTISLLGVTGVAFIGVSFIPKRL